MERKTRVFISFSHSPHERGLVEKLIKELQAHQIPTCLTAENLAARANWQREVEQAVKSADAVIVLVDPKREPDKRQQFEWSVALETQWEDPEKRLIPVLLGDAELPSFLSSRQVLRVKDPKRDWGRAVEELVHVVNNELTEGGEFVSVEGEDPAKRRERLHYIEEAAQSMKPQ
jgi:hypothetical protein